MRSCFKKVKSCSSILAATLFGLMINIECNAQIPNYVPTNGLVGWWPFNSNANDESGNGNNGTVNGATLTTDRFGQANRAYSFDGVDDYIQSNNLLSNLGSDFTISCYVNIRSWQGGLFVHVGIDQVSFPRDGFGYGYGGTQSVFPGQNYLGLLSDISWYQSGYQFNSLSTWYHAIVVRTNDTLDYFIDGTNVGSSIITTIKPPSNALFFGSGAPYWANFYGKLDDIGIWNRALTQQEITALYNGACTAQIQQNDTTICSGQSVTLSASTSSSGIQACAATGLPSNLQSGLVGYWPFCGNANDASGNGNNGTVNGATLTADRFGQANSAYSFDGINDFIQISNSSSLQNISNISAFAWVNIKNWYNGYFPILHKSNQGLHGRYAISLNTGGAIAHLATKENGLGYNQWSLNTWFQVGYSIDATTTKFYLNGQEIASTPSGVFPNSFSDVLPLIFGADFPGLVEYSNGSIDDIVIYNRILSNAEVGQLYNLGLTEYLWNNGTTASSITVTPTQSTTYTVTVTNNGFSCVDSVRVSVSKPTVSLGTDTIVCGESLNLNAAGSNSSYNWNTGDTTSNINLTSSGLYAVTVTNADGCKATDSIRVDIVNAKIIQNDTAICLGDSIRLYADTSNNVNQICSLNDLSQNLRNGLVSFYPFCGNANDISGNGNNGTVNGATLCPDRANKPDAAYSFNGTNNTINYSQPFLNGTQVSEFTMRAVVKFNSTSNSPNIWGKTLFWGEVNFLVANTNYIVVRWANSLTGNKYSSIYSNTNVIQTGLWYDIVVVYKNSSGQIYVNGTPITTNLGWTAQGGSLLSTTQIESRCNFAQDANSSKIGLRTSGGGPGNYLNGFLDEFDIWNRALSPTEIAQLDTISAKYISGGASYIWSTGDTTASILVSPSQSTSYNLVVTQNGNSCSDSVRVSVSKPTVSITATDSIFCTGDSVLITANGASSYLWNNGINTAATFANQSFAYTVIGTDSLGCKDTAAINTIIADTLTWNGSEDNDWHKGCNWSPAKVPACCNSVVVPLTFNQPIVTGVAGCKDITIHSTNGARLQVNNGANLQIEQCPTPPIRNGCN